MKKIYCLLTAVLLLFIGMINCFGDEIIKIPNQKVNLKIYSQITTNWDWYTNSNIAYVGSGTNEEPIVLHDKSASAYVGVVTSNNVCDMIYDGEVRSSTILSSNKIGEIWITWETQSTVYTTNYNKINNSEQESKNRQ